LFDFGYYNYAAPDGAEDDPRNSIHPEVPCVENKLVRFFTILAGFPNFSLTNGGCHAANDN
jgi:hypothetical protein